VSLRLFEAFGVELEYMLVDAATLDVAPVADRTLQARAGEITGELEAAHGISWSNELVAHVIELKTTSPTADLDEAAKGFAANVDEINAIGGGLSGKGGWGGGPVYIMPGAMHPWMDPAKETTLWPHEYGEVYANFHRLFNCYRHGWANLQSVHLNLPFSGDEEFGRLHAAVRLVLPLLPAICASSPVMDGRLTGTACNRLEVYRHNQAAVPTLSGRVIPEPVYTQADYQSLIMEPIARDVGRLDDAGLMKPEWMNSRGAIARFDRGSIEIRVMDVQECPRADLDIVQGVVAVLKWLVAEGPCSLAAQQRWPIDPLVRVLDGTIRAAGRAVIDDPAYLAALGYSASGACRADELWERMLEQSGVRFGQGRLAALEYILKHGTLSDRIAAALGNLAGPVAREELRRIYGELCGCIQSKRQFGAAQN